MFRMHLHHCTIEETHVVQLVDDKLTVAHIVLPMGNSPLQWLEEGMVHLYQGKESLLWWQLYQCIKIISMCLCVMVLHYFTEKPCKTIKPRHSGITGNRELTQMPGWLLAPS